MTCLTAATRNTKQECKSDEIMVDSGDDDLFANTIDKQSNWNTITRLMSSLLLYFFSISSMVVDAQSQDHSTEQLKKCLNMFSKEVALFGVSLYSFTTIEKEGVYHYIVYCCSKAVFCFFFLSHTPIRA